MLSAPSNRDGRSFFGPASLVSLFFAGLRLDQATYREVSRQSLATHQCIGVALLGAVGLGFERAAELGFVAPLMIVVEMARTAVTLVIESGIVWTVGRLTVAEPPGFGHVLRPVALAGAPALLYFLVALTGIQTPIRETVSLWLVLAFVIAVRSALASGWALSVVVTIAVWGVGWALHEMLLGA